MLPISDVLEVAMGGRDAGALSTANPARYDMRAPVIVWNTTNQCNMACPHCYSSAKYKKPKDDLTPEQALQAIDRLAEGGVRILIFSGGEPLLRPDLPDLIAYASERGLACQLSSNGVLLDEKRVQVLKHAGVRYVGVSIDGLAPFNNQYRRYADGFQLALDGLRRVRDAGLKTGVRMTVTKRNEDHLNALIELSDQENFDRFYLSHLLYEGRGAGCAEQDLNQVSCRSLMDSIFLKARLLIEAGSPLRLVTGGNDADGVYLYRHCRGRFGADAAQRVRELLQLRGGNSAGEKVLNIDHRGDVHPDQFWRSLYAGNILESSLDEIRNHPRLRALRNRVQRLKGRCGICRHVNLCRGSHRERALQVHGDMWASDPACYLLDSEVLTPAHESSGAREVCA